jgi:hypothetical protein
MDKSQHEFMAWLKNYDLPLYDVLRLQLKYAAKQDQLGALAPDQAGPEQPGFFAKISSGFGRAIGGITDSLSKLVPQYNAYKVDQSIIKAQIDRANRGLPPLIVQQSTNNRPIPVQIRSSVANYAKKSATSFFSKYSAVIPVVLGAGLLWVITTKKKGR